MNPSETSGPAGPFARECPAKRPVKKRDDHNAYMRAYVLRRYEERRARAIAELGGACADCGATERLQFDHADRSSKALDIAKRLHGAPWELVRAELAKCVLRCGPCHQVKTIRERGHRIKNPGLLEHAARCASRGHEH